MSKQPKDPFAEREAMKYENPIASRELILHTLEQTGVPMRLEEIAGSLRIQTEEQQTALHRRLRAMERDGQILFNRRRQYCLASKIDLISGRVIAHPSGFGFLVPDKGGDDLYLSASEMGALMNGDRAVVREIGQDRRGRREAVLVEILERGVHRVVGRLFIEAGVGFVIADNKRITHDVLIPSEDFHGARHGQIVTVEIVEYPTRNRQAIGRVLEILGDHMAPGMEIDIAIRNYELPQQWSPEVEAEITQYTELVGDQDKRGREDLTRLPLVTIDGEDARDFDDAVYCERKGKGFRLIVAIADVSHYVEPGTALDAEAKHRGNSVYFPERVIPMLPEVLSNGLCSLNPLVDRLCMVCDMEINASGALKQYRFYPAVMHSHARLTYTKVAAMLVDQDPSLRNQYRELVPHLENLYALFQVLLTARNKRGAIDFESTETRIVFGVDRKIERIIPVMRNDAHRLIEECMLMANVAAADYLDDHKIAALYRNHEPPGEEKLTELREFLGELGLNLGGGDEPQPKHYAKLLEQVKGRLDAHLIQTVMLRSLRQAVYAADNLGHFGLAFDAYAHFTSPIRRYPDLLVHRAIRHILSRKKSTEFVYSPNDMNGLGDHCSMTERRADMATRDAVDWLKCEYMLDKLGCEFDGIITTVTNFGIFVELSEIYVEGLVHVTALGQDYFQFDAVHHRMIGERTNKIYRLGDPVRVKVARVDLDERKIDFELLDGQAGSRTDESGKAGKSRKRKGKSAAAKSKSKPKQTEKASERGSRKAKQHGGKKKTAAGGRKKKTRRKA
jgi:ribonuclease R